MAGRPRLNHVPLKRRVPKETLELMEALEQRRHTMVEIIRFYAQQREPDLAGGGPSSPPPTDQELRRAIKRHGPQPEPLEEPEARLDDQDEDEEAPTLAPEGLPSADVAAHRLRSMLAGDGARRPRSGPDAPAP